MFQRGWFHLDVRSGEILPGLLDVVRQYGPARVQACSERVVRELAEPGRFAGLVVQLAPETEPWLERVLACAPAVSVLALLDDAGRVRINRLQAQGVATAVLPLEPANVESFVKHALASSFVSSARVARLMAHLARTRALTPREVQLLSYCLGNEPRARVRRRLGITENTLKTQVRGLLRKCGERSLDALAKNLLRSALSPEPPSLDSEHEAGEPTRPMATYPRFPEPASLTPRLA